MKVIEVKEYTPPVGQEYSVIGYPGPGAYLRPDGYLTLVADGCAWNVAGGAKLVREQEAPAGGCDAHHLLDQIIRVAGK